MAKNHPPLEVLEQLALSGDEGGVAQQLRWHLRNCAECQARLKAIHLVGEVESVRRRRGGEEVAKEAYARVLDKVFEQVVSESVRLEDQRLAAPGLMAELLGLTKRQRILLVRNTQRFHVWPLAEELIARSRELWTEDAGEAEALADLALTVADQIDANGLRARLLNDLRAEAWSCIANCRRIASNFAGAEAAFQKAGLFLNIGSGDSIERARVLDLRASFMAAKRDYATATKYLDQAIRAYEAAGDRSLVGRAFLKQAKFLGDYGKLDQSIALLEHAVDLFDKLDEPNLAFLAKKNLVLFLSETGRLDEAQTLLPEVRALARKVGSRLERLRLIWTEGLLRKRLGQHELAAEALWQVREGFIAAGIGYDVALVSLDLSVLLLETGQSDEVRRLAMETMPIFASLKVHRELLVAWNLFHQAAQRDAATVQIVHEAARRIRKIGTASSQSN